MTLLGDSNAKREPGSDSWFPAIAGPGLEAVSEDVTDRRAPGQPHASPQSAKSFKRDPDWQLNGIPLPGTHFARQELCPFFSAASICP